MNRRLFVFAALSTVFSACALEVGPSDTAPLTAQVTAAEVTNPDGVVFARFHSTWRRV